MKMTDQELCDFHKSYLGKGPFAFTLDGFSAWCYNNKTIDELREALARRASDKTDCQKWGITPTIWRWQLEVALAAKLIDKNSIKMKISVGDSSIGFHTAIVSKTESGNYQFVHGTLCGRKYLLIKALAALNRGESSYTSPSGDCLEIRVANLT